ncbi:hypothetical protein [uncultured Treponema sp.]|uniref:hypothetical protein n=1 Tax=uncultured Treponema sp. TaxID=162155 RepID=UPI0025E2341E|nr:hypothetical protein [uncultured Treponema sp.]
MKKIKKLNIFESYFLLLFLLCILRFKIFAASHLFGFLIVLVLFVPLCFSCVRTCFFNKAEIKYFSIYASIALFSWYFSNNLSENNIFYYLLFYTLPIFYYSIIQSFLKKITLQQILYIFNLTISVFKMYLLVEVVYRYYTSYIAMISEGLISSFYNFKGNSFYSDSNFLALVIQNFALVCFFLYKKFNDKKYFRNYIQLMFFALLTLSRSVVLTQIMLLLFDFYYSKFEKGQFARFFLLTIIFAVSLILVFLLLQKDASFRSKIVIFDGLKKINSFNFENQLFGFGFGNGEFIYSYRKGDYGHLHIALLLGQEGIIGVIMFITFLLFSLVSSKGATLRLVFAFLISGFSLAFFDTSFYLCLGIITSISKKIVSENSFSYCISPKIISRS